MASTSKRFDKIRNQLFHEFGTPISSPVHRSTNYFEDDKTYDTVWYVNWSFGSPCKNLTSCGAWSEQEAVAKWLFHRSGLKH